ncbi:hypothetical protein UFOVP143_2 [uncultured Caudovirales phage]|uniref:Uncharacterized protein n=1 Tax=uncultured Caudovirales phage TaxID=2100421 RepID=A0A6J7VLT7_9CAUD|nr:hypothetical protein UFOVP143_2 [uncultured Caudovirales phage]
MCVPIIGAVIGAAGSIFSGMAAASAANGQAAVYKAEKQAQLYQAQSEANAGSYESSIKLDEGKRLLGKQVTGLASMGVDVSTGTPGEIITDSASAVNMDVAAIRHNWQDKSNLSSYNAKIAGLNAKIASNNAKMAMIGGVVGAISPLVGAIPGTNTTSSYG